MSMYEIQSEHSLFCQAGLGPSFFTWEITICLQENVFSYAAMSSCVEAKVTEYGQKEEKKTFLDQINMDCAH